MPRALASASAILTSMIRLSRPWLIIGSAAIAALFLTITQPAPEGLVGLGVGNRVVRAAPGKAVPTQARKHNLAALDIVNQTLIKIRESYVDPARIDPKEMLYAALDSVQFNIPEVLVEPDRANDRVIVHVSNKEQAFSTADINSPWRLSKTLKRVFRFLEANMNPGANLAEIEYAATNGILSTLDPHSILLDPEQAREMNVSTGGGFSGLGIVIGMRDKKLTVIRPMPDTPASNAGILSKDEIVRINEEVTENLTLEEAVDRMRGKKGTKVTVWIRRKSASKLIRFDLVRDSIHVASVESKLLSHNVGYIKLKQFSSPTAKETKAALRKLKDGGATAFVLDLRSNPGGLLDQAIQVSDVFLDQGTIVTTVTGSEREAHRATSNKTVTRAPLVVLMNSNSASASEILGGALKNLDRAIIIGDTSFGKGSVQSLYDVEGDESILKLTIAQYLTPGDLSIQGIGITPDVELRRTFVPEKNTGPKDYLRLLPRSHSYRESDLKASLNSEYAHAGLKAKGSLAFVYERPARTPNPQAGPLSDPQDPDEELTGPIDEEAAIEEEDEFDSDVFVEDFEIRFAKEFVANYGKGSRKASLKNVDKALLSWRDNEAKRLRDKLTLLGVDWSPAPKGLAPGKLKAAFSIDGDATKIAAGSTVKLTGILTNTGTQDIYQAQARVVSNNPTFNDTELVFGKIAPGESKSWTAQVRVNSSALDRQDDLKLEVIDAAHSDVKVLPIKARILATERPVFSYSHHLIDLGNGDGLVQRGERHKLRIQVRNSGKGIAEQTVALLRNASGKDLVLGKARFDLESLKPGDSKTVDFEFSVADAPKDDVVVIELSVYDSTLGESVSEKLRFPVQPASAGPSPASGRVKVTESVSVFEGASATSALVAKAPKGTVFGVTGKQGDWLRVGLGNGLQGFINKAHSSKASGPAKLTGLDLRMQVTPPTLTLEVPTYETMQATYALKGLVSDDSKVEDVYIFVSNMDAKIDNRKVFYQSNRGSASAANLAFIANIPLWPGSNAVTVVARENDRVHAVKTLFLTRGESKTAAR